jgi:hypothetical protein
MAAENAAKTAEIARTNAGTAAMTAGKAAASDENAAVTAGIAATTADGSPSIFLAATPSLHSSANSGLT